ncbi:helix-turn-helix domain-containing protein [Microlunatus sp. GCM10028923]|uniref:helix-turn-helix domain-containing protein n=1 Tax=Microlunatus sp. GCM10028923 TaxID=3273400 RepID=UPI003606C58D
MGLIYNDLVGQVPLVQRVWSATCDVETGFASAAKAYSTICFARGSDGVTVHLKGPETQGTLMTCPEDWEFFGVELRPGAYLPLHPPAGLTDFRNAVLPALPSGRFLLDGQEWEMPTEQNVDVLVNRLVHAGLLIFDPFVDEIRHGERPRGMSERTAQLRFRRATGISHRKLAGIEQARYAAQLLTAGSPIAEVINAAGYYDHPHLTRAMRWATGQTPSELRAGTSFLAL